MLSSVSLRDQVASIIDALSKAAVAQIAKVVEDDVVVLRLEMCQRESEIKKLKRNIEILHSELRAAQQPRTVTPSPADRQRRDDCPIDDERTLPEKTQADTDQSSLSVSEVKSEVQVKSEPEGEATFVKPDQLCSYERDKTQWRPTTQGRDDCPIDVDDERTFPDADTDQSRLSVSSFQVKSAPEDATIVKPDQPCSYERDKAAQWRPTTIPFSVQNNNSDYLNLGQRSMLCPPEDRGLASSSRGGLQQGYGQYRSLYNVVRRRTGMKRLMFKKGFLCPYCGKYFERSGHMERHKRIHTGEKPYRCEVCGRRFNQKCSLKEHMKIHRRHMQPRPFEIPVCEQKQIPVVNPCTDTHRAEKESLIKAEDVLPKNQDLFPTALHIKAEPTEENIAPPLCHKDENQQTMAVADNLSDDLTTFERDGNHWMSRLPGQNGQKISSSEYLGSNVQSSFQGIRQLLRSPNEASCSTFSSFQSKPYGEFKNDTISLTPYGGSSSDMIMIAGESASHHGPIGSLQSFQMMKPKKCFVCSYCGKVFERSGHLERHLRIHTGEKPYECDVCGRCFNQKSSLKGHMKTHRNGDSTDMLDTHHLMFTSENQMLKNLAEHRNGPTALEEPLPGSMYAGEPTVMVKLEPNGEDLQSLGQPGTGAQDQSQLWTSAVEKNGEQNVSVLFNEQQRYTSQIKDLSFLQEKENEKIIHNEQYLMMAMQSRSSDMTMAPELQDQILTQEMAVNEYSSVSDRTHNDGGAFDFNMATTGDNDNDTDGTQQNCYICSACGQSFDNFGLFHRHQCQGATEQSFSCEICGKVFKQMSILKLHLKLHVESNNL